MVAPWQCDRMTVASSSTVQAIRVVSGPIEQPLPMVVPACSWVPGSISVSAPMVTSAWIQVVAGSCTVTPASCALRTSRGVQHSGHLGQLNPVVDALGLDRVRRDHRADATTVAGAIPTTSVR